MKNGDITIRDVQEMLDSLIKDNYNDSKASMVTGITNIYNLDDNTFVAWYNGLIPSLRVSCNPYQESKIHSRALKLGININTLNFR